MRNWTQERGLEYAHEKGDCTVRALATIAQMPYSAAHEELKRAGRRNRCGFNMAYFLRFKNYSICNYNVVTLVRTQDGFIVDSEGNLSKFPRTLGQLLASKRFQAGRYLVRVSHHVLTIIDGLQQEGDYTGKRSRITGLWVFRAR